MIRIPEDVVAACRERDSARLHDLLKSWGLVWARHGIALTGNQIRVATEVDMTILDYGELYARSEAHRAGRVAALHGVDVIQEAETW